MKCTDAKENLDALLDGEIEIARRRKIEIHLEACASCQAEYRNLQAFSRIFKQNLMISAPTLLDEKVFSAFKGFHREKALEKTPPEKNGWFGIPRLAFAAALFLCALTAISAFQLGRMSAAKTDLSGIETKTGAAPTIVETANVGEANSPDDSAATTMRTFAVPVIREKIIRVPVVREKIIVRTVYKNLNAENRKNDGETVLKNADNQNFTVKSRLKDNQYSTQVNLKGFQIVSELKPIIIKGENNEE